jgi:hypothetical protein
VVKKRLEEMMRVSLPLMTPFGSQSWTLMVWQIHFLVINSWLALAVMRKLYFVGTPIKNLMNRGIHDHITVVNTGLKGFA